MRAKQRLAAGDSYVRYLQLDDLPAQRKCLVPGHFIRHTVTGLLTAMQTAEVAGRIDLPGEEKWGTVIIKMRALKVGFHLVTGGNVSHAARFPVFCNNVHACSYASAILLDFNCSMNSATSVSMSCRSAS